MGAQGSGSWNGWRKSEIHGGRWSAAGHEGSSIGNALLEGTSCAAAALPLLQHGLAWAGMPLQGPLRCWPPGKAAASGESGIISELGRGLLPRGDTEGPSHFATGDSSSHLVKHGRTLVRLFAQAPVTLWGKTFSHGNKYS